MNDLLNFCHELLDEIYLARINDELYDSCYNKMVELDKKYGEPNGQ